MSKIEPKKISDVIEGLQKVKKEHGDLDCISASDEEGNSFGYVYFSPTPMNYDGEWEARDPNSKEYPVNAVCIN